MPEWQSIYCDESNIHSGSTFYLGALCGSPRRMEILQEALSVFRTQHDCTAEMKWVKVSRSKLSDYQAFVDIFFDDDFAHFHVLQVQQGKSWKKWGANADQRFFKSYYFFLRGLMRPSYCRYEIYLDYKDGKPYRWQSLKIALNRAIARDYEQMRKPDTVAILRPKNSKECDLIQLVDVLLGAMTTSATARAKSSLARYVRRRAKELTRSSSPKQKITHDLWSPYEERIRII